VIAYSIQASAPPLPVFLFAFVFTGMGISIQVSQSTGYVAALQSHTRMGIFEACYGFGAFCAPLVATQFANSKRWSFHFLVSLGIALTSIGIAAWVFKFKHQDECLMQIGRDPGEKSANSQSSMRQLLSLKTVHSLAAFAFIYTGTEVTVGGTTVLL
jgi:fucose permease